jgi:hypothetical protein
MTAVSIEEIFLERMRLVPKVGGCTKLESSCGTGRECVRACARVFRDWIVGAGRAPRGCFGGTSAIFQGLFQPLDPKLESAPGFHPRASIK